MTEIKTIKAIKYISDAVEYPSSSPGQQHYSIDTTIKGTNIEVVKSYYSSNFQEHIEEIGEYCKENDIALILVDTQSIMDEYQGVHINMFIDDVYSAQLGVIFANQRSEKELYSS